MFTGIDPNKRTISSDIVSIMSIMSRMPVCPSPRMLLAVLSTDRWIISAAAVMGANQLTPLKPLLHMQLRTATARLRVATSTYRRRHGTVMMKFNIKVGLAVIAPQSCVGEVAEKVEGALYTITDS